MSILIVILSFIILGMSIWMYGTHQIEKSQKEYMETQNKVIKRQDRIIKLQEEYIEAQEEYIDKLLPIGDGKLELVNKDHNETFWRQ